MGFFAGLKAYLAVEVFGLQNIQIKNYTCPIRLRQATTDRKVFREVFLFREYDFKTENNPSVIVDGGANVGLSTIFFAARFPQATVYAIEPDAGNFNALMQNAKHFKGVMTIKSAIWSNDTYLRISSNHTDAWAFEVEETTAADPAAFQAVAIESLMNTYDLTYIDLLKLDVEGAERAIFASNYEYWLPRTKVIIIELHDWIHEGCSRSFFQAISKYRFAVKIHSGMLLLTNLDLQ